MWPLSHGPWIPDRADSGLEGERRQEAVEHHAIGRDETNGLDDGDGLSEPCASAGDGAVVLASGARLDPHPATASATSRRAARAPVTT